MRISSPRCTFDTRDGMESVQNSHSRVSYMTYAMKIQEERDEAKAEGIVEGRTKGRVEAIKSLMEKKGWSIDEALDALSIPEMEWNQYKIAIQG